MGLYSLDIEIVNPKAWAWWYNAEAESIDTMATTDSKINYLITSDKNESLFNDV